MMANPPQLHSNPLRKKTVDAMIKEKKKRDKVRICGSGACCHRALHCFLSISIFLQIAAQNQTAVVGISAKTNATGTDATTKFLRGYSIDTDDGRRKTILEFVAAMPNIVGENTSRRITTALGVATGTKTFAGVPAARRELRASLKQYFKEPLVDAAGHPIDAVTVSVCCGPFFA